MVINYLFYLFLIPIPKFRSKMFIYKWRMMKFVGGGGRCTPKGITSFLRPRGVWAHTKHCTLFRRHNYFFGGKKTISTLGEDKFHYEVSRGNKLKWIYPCRLRSSPPFNYRVWSSLTVALMATYFALSGA